jgi:hypothetical protein
VGLTGRGCWCRRPCPACLPPPYVVTGHTTKQSCQKNNCFHFPHCNSAEHFLPRSFVSTLYSAARFSLRVSESSLG